MSTWGPSHAYAVAPYSQQQLKTAKVACCCELLHHGDRECTKHLNIPLKDFTILEVEE